MGEAHEQFILIIDDDAGMRQAMGRLLSAAGYATRICGSAEEAATLLSADVLCLVVDVHLTGISGTSWYATLGPHRPPAVFVTAFDNAEVRVAVHQIGDCTYLTKPFDGQALIGAVKSAVTRVSNH